MWQPKNSACELEKFEKSAGLRVNALNRRNKIAIRFIFAFILTLHYKTFNLGSLSHKIYSLFN